MGIASRIAKNLLKVSIGGEEKSKGGMVGSILHMHGIHPDAIGQAYDSAMDLGLKGAKSMVKKTDATFYNGYTGLKPTALATGVAWVGAAGYVGYSSLKTKANPNINPGQIEYEAQAPIFSGDGSGVKSPGNNSLGASGSLVFGLNSMRKG